MFEKRVIAQTGEKNIPKKVLTCIPDNIEVDPRIVASITKCLEVVNETIELSSALPGKETNARAVENARKDIDSETLCHLTNGKQLTLKLLVHLIAVGIKCHKAGNCFEFALYCHYLLLKAGIDSEIVRVKGQGNHVFLVVNRNKNFPMNHFQNWNKDALVVDPFFSRIYSPSEIENILQCCVHDEENNKINYIPFNPAIHTLDNDVLQGLFEDWKEVLKQYNVAPDNEVHPRLSALRF